MSLETSIKIPQGFSPVTGQKYFPASFNCIQEIHQLSRSTDQSKFFLFFSLKHRQGFIFSLEIGKFNRPRKVGDFSIDGERKFHDNNSQMKYFAPPV